MTNVSLAMVSPRLLAAVRRQVRIGEVARAWRPALDEVWNFLRATPGLRQDGHNIFLYHHPSNRQLPMDVDFGVEVLRQFDQAGEVYPTATPAGKVVTAVHVGSYARMQETHSAIHDWAKANQVKFAGKSWEIYGDWINDESKLQTQIFYLIE